jgi:hypothetical protein
VTPRAPFLAAALALVLASGVRAEDPPQARKTPSSWLVEEPASEPKPQWGLGPFEIYDPFILADLRAAPYARSPRTLAPMGLELGLRGTWENSFGIADDSVLRDPTTGGPLRRFTLDAETRTLDLVARYGIIPRVELGAELRAVDWRGGGILDAMVRQWHRTFGIGTLGRDLVRNNSFTVQSLDADGRRFELPNKGTFLGDAAATLRVLALEGSDVVPAVALSARLWLPTASPGSRHASGTAETFQVDASKRLGNLPLIIYAGGGYTYYDQTSLRGLELERHRGMYYAGFEWEITDGLSFVVHFWQESPRERALFRRSAIPYGNYITYIAGGFKLEPVEGFVLELGILENGIDPNTTGDIGFLFNIWYRRRGEDRPE